MHPSTRRPERRLAQLVKYPSHFLADAALGHRRTLLGDHAEQFGTVGAQSGNGVIDVVDKRPDSIGQPRVRGILDASEGDRG